MCGRYALGIRAFAVRQQLEEYMPVDDAPDDDDVRQTYNFAPGSYGLVYRADVPDYGAGPQPHEIASDNDTSVATDHQQSHNKGGGKIRYKLQAMKWGLVPFWTKRNPDYGSVLKSINARDDSLIENRGMWTTMKQRKRCIVVAQGFFEWLKKNNGREKIPHFTKRKDGQLMCFAGLWDCVQYEGSDEKHYTYTIITTDSNKQLSFLHDRMPVILENGSDQISTWLDPSRYEWSKELQCLLKPYHGELDCYPVHKDVGKVGNNSAAFIIPVASSENKQNIANFFANPKLPVSRAQVRKDVEKVETEVKGISKQVPNDDEEGTTVDVPRTEDNAPMPAAIPAEGSLGIKRERDDEDETTAGRAEKVAKIDALDSEKAAISKSPEKPVKKLRSAISNRTSKPSPIKAGDGSRKITSFFAA